MHHRWLSSAAGHSFWPQPAHDTTSLGLLLVVILVAAFPHTAGFLSLLLSGLAHKRYKALHKQKLCQTLVKVGEDREVLRVKQLAYRHLAWYVAAIGSA